MVKEYDGTILETRNSSPLSFSFHGLRVYDISRYSINSSASISTIKLREIHLNEGLAQQMKALWKDKRVNCQLFVRNAKKQIR